MKHRLSGFRNQIAVDDIGLHLKVSVEVLLCFHEPSLVSQFVMVENQLSNQIFAIDEGSYRQTVRQDLHRLADLLNVGRIEIDTCPSFDCEIIGNRILTDVMLLLDV